MSAATPAPRLPAAHRGARVEAEDDPITQPLPPPQPVPPVMDREFVQRNQIVERYLAGKLPPRGAHNFERFCGDHPELVESIGLAAQVNAGLRLLEASGKPEPWAQVPRRFWEKLPFVAALGAAVVVLAVLSLAFGTTLAERGESIRVLERKLEAQPLEPSTSTRPVLLIPSRTAPSTREALAIGGEKTEFADFRIDVSWSKFTAFRVTIDRLEQGRVAVIHNLTRDSNGHLRLALNSSALGPGSYQLALEGLNWKGEPVPQAWITVGIR